MSQGSTAAARGDRLKAFTTQAEEQWLAGTGPPPVSPAERLPGRAPVLLARAGIGRWVPVARGARAWAGADGTLWFQGPDAGAPRPLVPAGQARAGWWLVDRGPAGARLPVVDAGWLVISGAGGPLAALRLAEWLPGWAGIRADPGLARSAGAEAVCQALGVPFEAVADPAEAARRVGPVEQRARVELDQGPDWRAATVVIVASSLLLCVLFLVVARQWRAALVALAVALVLPVAADLLAWWRRRWRVRDLPGRLDQWWQAAPAGRPVAGRGFGMRAGPAGQEFVIADGHGGECWLAGAACGGAAGLVAASAIPGGAGGPPWALLLYDRDEQILAALRGADWVNGPAAMQTLTRSAARLQMSVTVASWAPQAIEASRDRALASVTTADPWLSLAVSRYVALAATVAALVAVIHGSPPAGYAFGGWAAVLVAGLFLAQRRAVL